MATQTVELDPNAVAYTDDEIVGKVNSGSASITREDALDQDALKLVKTKPTSGEFHIKNVHRGADGKIQVEYDDVAEP